MFREIRRKAREISVDAAKELLKNERRGVLSVIGDEGYPYAIPLNYVYVPEDNKIYFHGSKVGHKVDSLKKCDKVCFTVYGNEMIKDEVWAPYMQSAVVFGRCHMIDDGAADFINLRKMASKYYPTAELVEEAVVEYEKAVQMFEIEIEHISGKQIQEK